MRRSRRLEIDKSGEKQMKNYHKILAEKIRAGENVALYCYGILATHMILYLEKFYGVIPAVVIDNDPRKTGTADFGVPVMPFAEAWEQFDGLQYFICSDDYKYTIIGDMLEKGVPPEKIINYVPVEKRRTCLYFYNRLLLVRGSKAGTHFISHCNKDSFKPQGAHTEIFSENESYTETGLCLDKAFSNFEAGAIAACKDCIMNKEQYIVGKDCQRHYKSVAFYQATCSDCLSHCVYCCVGGNSKGESQVRLNSLESYGHFIDSVFALDRVDDDFTCAIDMSERELDRKIAMIAETVEKSGLHPLAYKVNSCLLTYDGHLAELMRQGMAYVIWSLDAGTRETYRKIKQIDAFENVMKNIRRYIEQDAYGGKLIVAKYLIVKGINDNDEEFDAFLKVVTSLGLKFISLSFDFYVKADQSDLEFIWMCNHKAEECGLQLTYKNNSLQVTEALKLSNILSQ